jgi:hypothetical protein
MRVAARLIKQLEADCDQFNATHKPGDPIRFWSGLIEGEPREGVIRYGACIMGGHTAVVYVAGVGSIALSHIASLPLHEGSGE